MKLHINESNYERLADKYNLDIYEDNHATYNVFNNKTGEILIEKIPTIERAICETISVFNENIQRKTYKKTKDRNNLFRYYPI